ncbi:MAG: uracil-DNA glycosylase family protein [Rhodospirillaceae bacterium]
MAEQLEQIAARARACRICDGHLPLGPRPVFRVSETARLLIVGQAPGTKVHQTGVPWNDASGDTLRFWMGVDRDTFYDEARVAIIPMGLCYPGRDPKGGDNPPRPECAPLWHDALRGALPAVELTLLVGQYAQRWHLGRDRKPTMTETVAAWHDYTPATFPLPHPSWRSTGWRKRHPWFEDTVLPDLRQRCASLLNR